MSFTTAAKVAAHKMLHPHLYCKVDRCLWRVRKSDGTVTPCRKHAAKQEVQCTQS